MFARGGFAYMGLCKGEDGSGRRDLARTSQSEND